MKKNKLYIIGLILVLSLLAACSTPSKDGSEKEANPLEELNPEDPIVLGSFVDTEGGILGNMVLLALEEKGYTITDKVQFGTPDVHRMYLSIENSSIF